MGKILKFILGTAIGAGVGSAVVMMLAPSSGIELRDHVRDYIQNVKDEVARARESRRVELEQELAKLRKPAA